MSKRDSFGQEDRSSGKRKIILVLVIIIAIVFTLCAIALVVINSYLGKINRFDEDQLEIVLPEDEYFTIDDKDHENSINPDDILWPDALPAGDDDLINILIVGQDSENGQVRQRSDTMILCSINVETEEIALISFLRDLYVDFPGDYSANRLNASYAFGGLPLLRTTLIKNFGITIDGSVEIDFSQFETIIDTLGGITINYTEEEARVLLQKEAGPYLVDGKTALVYARLRETDNDFYRTGRQRNVINAVLSVIRTKTLDEVLGLLDVILPSITTDMTNLQMFSTATRVFPMIKGVELQSYHIPTDDAYYYGWVNGMSVLIPDMELCNQHLRDDMLPLS